MPCMNVMLLPENSQKHALSVKDLLEKGGNTVPTALRDMCFNAEKVCITICDHP